MTRRRWIADDWDNQSASLKGEQAAHLIRVLRAQTGMECDMVAGDRVWRAVISGISGDAVQFALLSEVEAEPALPVTLLLSVFKFDRMECGALRSIWPRQRRPGWSVGAGWHARRRSNRADPMCRWSKT